MRKKTITVKGEPIMSRVMTNIKEKKFQVKDLTMYRCIGSPKWNYTGLYFCSL